MQEILELNADIVAVQEVPHSLANDGNNSFIRYLAEKTDFPFSIFRSYPSDENEGLGFLSKVPISSTLVGWGIKDPLLWNECAIRINIEIEGKRVAFTNVHLDSYPFPVSLREKQICIVNSWINRHTNLGTYEILLGDFNCYQDSSVHRFLCGHQSLLNKSTYWHDLALVYHHQSGLEPKTTLDFVGNSRWWYQHTLEMNGRFDWVMLKDCYLHPYPYIHEVKIFGDQLVEATTGHPSDHYGVFVTLTW